MAQQYSQCWGYSSELSRYDPQLPGADNIRANTRKRTEGSGAVSELLGHKETQESRQNFQEEGGLG